MKNSCGWTSEYRRKKFEKRYYNQPDKDLLPLNHLAIQRSISILLDIQGTCDNIDDEKAKRFVLYLDRLRKKFKADYVTISISTHYTDGREIKNILDIISRNLISNIRIGDNFFLGGIYNYDSDKEISVFPNFNYDKIETFLINLVTLGRNVVFMAVFDDFISDEIFKRISLNSPVLVGKPSSKKNDLKRNSLCRIATETKSFDGVLEIMTTYLESIIRLSVSEIVETQKRETPYFPISILIQKIANREYEALKRYFTMGLADDKDIEIILDLLISINMAQKIPPEENRQVKTLLEIIINQLEKQESIIPKGKIITLQKLLNTD